MRWSRILLTALSLAACSGCATVAANVPSFQHCDQVTYTRSGNIVNLQAHCQLPIGGSSAIGAVVPGL